MTYSALAWTPEDSIQESYLPLLAPFLAHLLLLEAIMGSMAVHRQ
jgi:hypothetical protein